MPTKRYKHTHLFLLRVWCDDPEERDEGSDLKWHGRLQRPVSGEARSFEGREALIEVLEAMLYKGQAEYEQSSSSKKTS